MSGTPSSAHIKADVVAVIASVPRGKVVSFAAIGRCLGIMSRHVSTIVAGLEAAEVAALPWHRVVADGGAVGRHPRRDEHIARLRADGLTVSPAGIVAGLEHAMLTEVTRPAPGFRIQEDGPVASGQTGPQPSASSGPAPLSRARGRFDRPGTKLT